MNSVTKYFNNTKDGNFWSNKLTPEKNVMCLIFLKVCIYLILQFNQIKKD